MTGAKLGRFPPEGPISSPSRDPICAVISKAIGRPSRSIFYRSFDSVCSPLLRSLFSFSLFTEDCRGPTALVLASASFAPAV